MCLHSCQHTPDVTESLWSKILPVIVSSTILVLLFIVGRLLDSAIKAREIRRNWYQKVIIEPHLEKITAFYQNTINQIEISITFLVSQKTTANFEGYIGLKAQEIQKTRSIQRVFDYEFVQLVSTNFPEIANQLADHLRLMDDKIAACLDRQDLSEAQFTEIEKECVSQKNQIYRILYQPLAFSFSSSRFSRWFFRRR